jgi:hypothetical protein
LPTAVVSCGAHAWGRLGDRVRNSPTGLIFDGTGEKAFYIFQHGQQPDALLDFTSNPVDGLTDDLIQITGFELPSAQ